MTSPSLLDRCERRFGHLAIPGLIRIIAGFQVLCFILIRVNPAFGEFLLLTPAAWQNWEIWRFFTFCFIPGTTDFLWIIFVVMILLLIGDSLEAHWGRFRVNLYYAASVVALWAAVLVAGPAVGHLVGLQASNFLYLNLFFAFATLVPNHTFLIFFVLPVKVKWLAVLGGAGLLLQFVGVPETRLPLLLALLPYGVFGLPLAIRNVRHKAKVSSRRSRFQADTAPVGDTFHECSVCHRTDVSDPSLEFRIASDEQEYCVEHLPAKV